MCIDFYQLIDIKHRYQLIVSYRYILFYLRRTITKLDTMSGTGCLTKTHRPRSISCHRCIYNHQLRHIIIVYCLHLSIVLIRFNKWKSVEQQLLEQQLRGTTIAVPLRWNRGSVLLVITYCSTSGNTIMTCWL